MRATILLLLLNPFVGIHAFAHWNAPSQLILGNRMISESFLAQIQKAYPNGHIVDDETKEFSNSNTFVRIGENLTGKDVIVTLPKTIGTDALMEVLIKVRTALTHGARQIFVLSEAPLDSIHIIFAPETLKLNLAKLLTIAGAQRLFYLSGDRKIEISKPLLITPSQFPEPPTERSIVTDRNHPKLAQTIAAELNLQYLPPPLEMPLRGTQIFYFASSDNPVNENLFRALSDIQQWTGKGAIVTLVSPYLPYARSDKIDQAGVAVTGRLVADLIEGMGTHSILFARAHSAQSQGFFRIPSRQIDTVETLKSAVQSLGIDVVVAADNGFFKDALRIGHALGLSTAVVNKYRDPVTSRVEIVGIAGAALAGKTVLIVDDETASGETLALAAEYAIKKAGVHKAYAAVTHLAGNGLKAIGNSFLKNLIVTDSLHAAESVAGVELVSLAPELSKSMASFVRSKTCEEVLVK